MQLFLSVLEGDSPADASPVLATGDPQIVQIVARAIAERLGLGRAPDAVAREAGLSLRLVRPLADDEGEPDSDDDRE